MSIATTPSAAEWEAIIAQAHLPMSQRDLELVKKACERIDKMREDLRARIGTVDIAVELIRDARNEVRPRCFSGR
jgi:hypothetical protein